MGISTININNSTLISHTEIKCGIKYFSITTCYIDRSATSKIRNIDLISSKARIGNSGIYTFNINGTTIIHIRRTINENITIKMSIGSIHINCSTEISSIIEIQSRIRNSSITTCNINSTTVINRRTVSKCRIINNSIITVYINNTTIISKTHLKNTS